MQPLLIEINHTSDTKTLLRSHFLDENTAEDLLPRETMTSSIAPNNGTKTTAVGQETTDDE